MGTYISVCEGRVAALAPCETARRVDMEQYHVSIPIQEDLYTWISSPRMEWIWRIDVQLDGFMDVVSKDVALS